MEEIVYLWSEIKVEVGEYEIFLRFFYFIVILRLFIFNDDVFFYF